MKCQRCGKDNPADVHTCFPLALKLANQLELRHIGWEDAAAAELRRLHAENEALRTDAERYRWLRDKGPSAERCMLCGYDGLRQREADDLDAAVDAARAGEKT